MLVEPVYEDDEDDDMISIHRCPLSVRVAVAVKPSRRFTPVYHDRHPVAADAQKHVQTTSFFVLIHICENERDPTGTEAGKKYFCR